MRRRTRYAIFPCQSLDASRMGRCCWICVVLSMSTGSLPIWQRLRHRRRPMGWLDPLTKSKPPEASVRERMSAAYNAASRGDYTAALDIWTPLAHAGVARAQSNIGACFSEALGVERDPKLAERWLLLAAEAGDPTGQRNLATLYFKGEGVDQDNVRAAALYRGAAEQGDAQAQDMLSWMLLESEEIPADHAEARRWAQAAADQGVASSMTRLGMIFHNALGVDRDPAQAALWWQRGAAHGDADGQAMLGAVYHLGAGVARDPLTALVWLMRARAGGSPLAAQFFNSVRATLSPAEVEEAERRAALPLEAVS